MPKFDDSFDLNVDLDEYGDNEQDVLNENVANLFACFEHSYKTFRKGFRDDGAMLAHLKELAEKVSETASKEDTQGLTHENKFKSAWFGNRVKYILDNAKAKGLEYTGEEFYGKLKKAKIEVDNSWDKNQVKNDNRNKEAWEGLYGENNIFDDLSEMLDDGDKFYRGSSSEYKEIKSQINKLRDEIEAIRDKERNSRGEVTTDDRRYIVVRVKAILEKANQYVDERKSVAINYTQDSYKGKRIDIMQKVANRLSGQLAVWNNSHIYEKGDDQSQLSEKYMNKLKNRFEKDTFNATYYAEYYACAIMEDDNRALENVNDKFNELAKSDLIKTMRKALRDQKIDLETANRYRMIVDNKINDLKDELKTLDADQLEAKEEGLKKIIEKNDMGKNLEYLEEMLVDKNAIVPGAITGNRDLDRELARTQLKMVNSKIKELNKAVENAPDKAPKKDEGMVAGV